MNLRDLMKRRVTDLRISLRDASADAILRLLTADLTTLVLTPAMRFPWSLPQLSNLLIIDSDI